MKIYIYIYVLNTVYPVPQSPDRGNYVIEYFPYILLYHSQYPINTHAIRNTYIDSSSKIT